MRRFLPLAVVSLVTLALFADPAHAAVPRGTYFDGIPQVGTFFDGTIQSGSSRTQTHCTGSVVRSDQRNIVVTAGHCGNTIKGWLKNNRKPVFVPGFTKSKRYGLGEFQIAQVYMDPGYHQDDASSDLDFAFVRVLPISTGSVEEVVGGGLNLRPAPGYDNTVTVIGYPGETNTEQKQIKCTVPTSRLGNYHQMKMECDGYENGVSGSPFIQNFNEANHTGDVIAVLGGQNGGGPPADPVHSWGVAVEKPMLDMFDVAQGKSDGTPQPTLPGSAELWKHAKLVTSGDFLGHGHADMIVCWSDGEVTLYPGDGHARFGAERQLQPPTTRWKNANTMTGGDFAGGDAFDLMVHFADGETRLYPDVAQRGLANGARLSMPGQSPWTHVTQIAGGNFGDTRYATDLVVAWDDGELSLYLRADEHGFGTEHQLKPPNEAWKGASLLTTAQLSGDPTWDLIVRWSDGALDNFAGTNALGLGPQIRVQQPNGLWQHAQVISGGNYTGGPVNDLVVRWSDGETTLYEDNSIGSLGTEHTLVHP